MKSSGDPNRQDLDRYFRLDIRWVARLILSQGSTKTVMAIALCHSILHHGNQRLILPDPESPGREGVAESYAAQIRICLEGIKIHHALEAIEREV